jgi:hypothetical protein
MMTKYFYPIICAFAVISCKSNNTINAAKADPRSADVKQSVTAGKKAKDNAMKIVTDTSMAGRLLGFWAVDSLENATFTVDKNKFYYPDQHAYYAYKIKGDSVIVTYDDFKEAFKMEFKGTDSLTMSNANGVSKFFRFK